MNKFILTSLFLLFLFVVMNVSAGTYNATCDYVGGWNVSSAVYVQNISVTGNYILSPEGMFFKPDGMKMYVIGNNQDKINEFNLSVAWDISTAVNTTDFYVGDKDTEPKGLFFKPDGTKFYISGPTSDKIFEYDLSIAWDITSAVYLREKSISTKETISTGVFFKPDGTKMYISGDSGDSIDEWNLSDAWNVSSATYLRELSTISPQDLYLRSDGLKLYVITQSLDIIMEYDLSDAWNITSSTYLRNISVGSKDGNPAGVFFKPDGTKMYFVGDSNNMAYEYDLNYTIYCPALIEINAPLNQTYYTGTILLNITSTGQTTWYEYEEANVTYTEPVNLSFIAGTHIIKVYSNDTDGDENSTEITFTIKPMVLTPDLDVAYFGAYNLTANVSLFEAGFESVSANVTIKGINGQGGTCWDYYLNGTCGSEDLEFEMTNTSVDYWKLQIYPDYIYPEIYFASSDITWNNAPTNYTFYRRSYQLFNFTNNFTMENNQSFFIEFNVEPNATNSLQLRVYLVANTSGINLSYFEEDWTANTDAELVGTITRTTPFNHQHTENSSHHLVPLSTNIDGTIGTKNLNVSNGFWIILYPTSSTEDRGWKLKYHEEGTCNNTDSWFIADRNGDTWNTPVYTAGCPDAHIHIARRDNYIDGFNATVIALDDEDAEAEYSQEFYFTELGNIAPTTSTFITPTNGTYNGTIVINWTASSDPNEDTLMYNVTLRNTDGTYNQSMKYTNETSFNWNSYRAVNGTYDIMIEVCDEEPLCSNYSFSDQYDTFEIDNPPKEDTNYVIPIATLSGGVVAYIIYRKMRGRRGHIRLC